MFRLGRRFLVSYFQATAPPRSVAFFILLSVSSFFSILPLLVGGWQDASHTTQLYGIAINALLGFTTLALILFTNISRYLTVTSIFTLAIVFRILISCIHPLLEDDFYRYLWDGLQTFTTGNPYQHAPIAFFPGKDLSQEWQDVLSGINNPDLKTIYGPVLQYLFLFGYVIAPGDLWPIQFLLATIDIGIFAVLIRAKTDKRILLAYAIHPLILQEAIASAHPDIVLGGLLMGCFLAWRSNRPLLTGALLAAACSTKISAVLLIPFFLLPRFSREYDFISFKSKLVVSFFWGMKVILAGVVGLLLLYLPLISLRHSELESLMVFGQAWRFNPLYFRIIEFLFGDLVEEHVIRVLCGLLVVLLCGVLLWLQWQNKTEQQSPPLLAALIALLLLSPVVNPWYWLWLLPIAAVLQRKHLMLLCCLAPLSYCNSNTFLEIGWFSQQIPNVSFVVPWPVTIVQVIIFTFVFIQEWSLLRGTRHHRKNHSINLFC